MSKDKAHIQRDDQVIEVNSGDKIKSVCVKLGVPFGCEQGSCMTCKIEVIDGAENLYELDGSGKEILAGLKTRLACQARIKAGKVTIK